MKRRFNYTGRKTIPSGMISVTLSAPAPDGLRSFDVHFGNLLTLGLPTEARLFVEPYVKASSMRFDFGRVGAILPPADRALTEIDQGAGVLFRVLVVDEAVEIGKIIASAEGVAPAGEDNGRDPLLPIRMEDLGEAVWRLQAERGSAPRLLLNSRYHGIKQRLLNDPLLLGAILPAAVREALLFVREEDDQEAEWVGKWRRFVVEIAGEHVAERVFNLDEDENPDDIEDEVASICERLVERRRYMSRAIELAGSIADA